jgi:hypothetical protein
MKKIIYFLCFLSLSTLMFAQEDGKIADDIKGTLYLKDKTVITGDFITKFRDGYVPPREEFNNMVSLDGESSQHIVYYYPFKKRFKYKTIKAKDAATFEVGENEIYDVINYKPGPLSLADALDPGYMMKSPKPRFVLRVFKSEKIGVYKSGKDYIVYKEGEKAGISVLDLSAKKKLAKMVADCPSVSEKMTNDEYKVNKMNSESQSFDPVIQFAKDYTDCSK